jgi:protoheme IX farnesyltransferase
MVGLAGGLYALVAMALGAIFLALALAIYRTREGRVADHAARLLFAFSILYLFALFATLLVEGSIGRLLD